MAKRKAPTRVALSATQWGRLERLWFYYGNYGPKTTPGNHQFIQGLLEHGLDLRPLQTKRTPKSERPTEECELAVEAVLAVGGDSVGEVGGCRGGLRLVSPAAEERRPVAPDPELKALLDDLRRRQLARGEREGRSGGGDEAA